MTAEVQSPELLSCSCCGRGVWDTAKDNVAHGEIPYPYDNGFGMCRRCGGYPNGKNIKRQLGWGGRMFFEARFDVLRENLKPENAAKFEAMTYERKVEVIGRLVERGAMI